jgi:hypothetical protein
MRSMCIALVLATLPLLTGCEFLNSLTGAASNTAGDTIGKSIGDAIARQYTPQFAAIYAQVIFTYAFHSGAGWIEETAYAPGQWTRWRGTSSKESGRNAGMEKAFLQSTADGKEWWKVKFLDPESSDTIILEGLFTANRTQLLRLRGKFPGQEAGEIPVTEGSVYQQPTRLTAESLAGALVGEENVTVPAGTFPAKHYRYSSLGSGGASDWYLSDRVPGGLVKYGATSTSNTAPATAGTETVPSTADYSFELEAFGEDATSELGSI